MPGLSADTPIFVAGHRGMVGSAVVRLLADSGYKNIITANRKQLDLCRQNQVEDFFQSQKIGWVVMAAARVGGIHSNNTYPAEFIYQNSMIICNVIHAAYSAGVQQMIYLGSSCIYPRECSQPITEDRLLTGALELTNESYAIAKIAGLKLCEAYNRQYRTDYRSLMPTNLYGEGDYFHAENAHVIPALLRRFAESIEKNAPAISIWGTGKPRREFLHVNDLARACVAAMQIDRSVWEAQLSPSCSHVNIGTGKDISIKELAHLIAEVSGYQGEIVFDPDKPDGTMQKLLDVSRIRALGWEPEVSLPAGLKTTWEWYLQQRDRGQVRN